MLIDIIRLYTARHRAGERPSVLQPSHAPAMRITLHTPRRLGAHPRRQRRPLTQLPHRRSGRKHGLVKITETLGGARRPPQRATGTGRAEQGSGSRRALPPSHALPLHSSLASSRSALSSGICGSAGRRTCTGFCPPRSGTCSRT